MDLSLQLRMMSCLGLDSYIVVDQPSECSQMVDIIQHMYSNSLLCQVIIWSTQESNAATALCLTDLLLCSKYLGLMVLTRIERLRYLVADLSVA
jgi:hypothetical protein